MDASRSRSSSSGLDLPWSPKPAAPSPHGRRTTVARYYTIRRRSAHGTGVDRELLHPDLRRALHDLKPIGILYGPVIISRRGGALRPNSVVNFFVSLYRELGLVGCSSHSGRRSFITQAARNLHRAGCSLRDVQVLAGHRSIETTQRYIDGDTDAQRKLVALL
ncbi:site-specific integrase [Chelatococcus asaccharovorans]|nr:site-specific integrase [Chelatococcus asaccharovorans]